MSIVFRKKGIKSSLGGLKSISTVFILLLILLPSGLWAQGNLLITPRRVVFDGSTRSIDLNLANTGIDSATYSVSLIQIRMKEDGSFETINEPDPGQRFADKYLRYFPRKVSLAPGESQVVKVQVTRRSELDKGEYRSHFYFRAEKEQVPLGQELKTDDNKSISVKLTPVFGITIPAIIRVGNLSADVGIKALKPVSSGERIYLDMIITRSGDKSVYGNLAVDHISPSGIITRVAIANGLAVYTPNEKRNFRLALSKTGNIDYNKGTLKISYSSASDSDNKVLCQSELVLE